MSLPPPPDSFGSQPPTSGGQPGGGAPQHWAPQQSGGPAGPPQGGAPSWGPQQQWPGQQWPGSPPPRGGGGKTKWILGIIAVVLAIALAVVITVVLVRPDNSGNGPANAGASGSDSEFASANDTGPISIITEESTCDAWNSIARGYTGTAKSINWVDRGPTIPATSWTPEQRAMYESMEKALVQAADQTVNLVKATPHRVVRMLYEQFIAYTRAFVERIPTYEAKDDDLIAVSSAAGASLTNICGAITSHSAQAVAPQLSPVLGPTNVAQPDKVGSPTKLLAEPSAVCADWETLTTKFDSDAKQWNDIDKNVSAADWTPEQKTINEAFAPVLSASADEVERLGRKSDNSRFEDLAVLEAQYRRALAASLPNYASKDVYLALSGVNLNRLILWACKSAS
ncbi:hypothetical protein ACPCIR_15050 [Mycobacterium sp. NPDC051198]